jgi:hypothetical protein
VRRPVSYSKGAAPVITTLIPTYQRAALLGRAIRSALGQTYPHLQVRVYDNASADDTRQTVRQLSTADPRVSYFRHPTNIGAQKNFMHAMGRVETPFFSILSDDDILLPRFYETAMEGFTKYPEAILSATATLRMDDTGRILGAPLLKWKPGLYRPPDGFLAMLDKLHPDWTSIVFRREVLREAGELDEETDAPSDLDYMLRVAAHYPIAVSTEPGAIFVMHAGGYSSTPKVYTSPGWLKMIQNQTEDSRVPIRARAHAGTVLTKRLTQRLFLTNGFYSLVIRRWHDSHEAAHVLRRDYGLWIRASILSAAGWACQNLPLAHRALVTVYALRRLLTRLRQQPLQRQFGAYAAYLGGVRMSGK